MRRIFAAALAATVVLHGAAFAQTQVRILTEQKRATLMNAHDLDGLAADDDRLITAALGVIVSETDYTASIVAQPDTCRLHDITISDTNMGVGEGAITVVGTDCLGYAKSCSWSAWTAADDDGIKTLTCTDGKGAYFAAVTSITTGVMTAAATDEYFKLGYTSNSENTLVMYGRLQPPGPNGEHGVDPFGVYAVSLPITTSGVSSTTVTAVSSNGAFTNVVAGDLLIFSVSGFPYEVRVTARASANSITVSKAVTIPASGTPFSYKRKYVSTDPSDQLWIPVKGWSAVAFNYSVDSNTSTGGVTALLECNDQIGPDWPTGGWVTIDTVTTASTVVLTPTMTALGPIDLAAAPFSYCRLGVKFGTGDDDDTGVEDINLSVVLSK